MGFLCFSLPPQITLNFVFPPFYYAFTALDSASTRTPKPTFYRTSCCS